MTGSMSIWVGLSQSSAQRMSNSHCVGKRSPARIDSSLILHLRSREKCPISTHINCVDEQRSTIVKFHLHIFALWQIIWGVQEKLPNVRGKLQRCDFNRISVLTKQYWTHWTAEKIRNGQTTVGEVGVRRSSATCQSWLHTHPCTPRSGHKLNTTVHLQGLVCRGPPHNTADFNTGRCNCKCFTLFAFFGLPMYGKPK